MADKNPKDGFEILDADDAPFAFPGAEQDDLTERERSFTFDEDYLDDRPAAEGKEPAEPDTAAASRVDAVFSAFQKLTQKKTEPDRERNETVDALAGAFRKLTGGAKPREAAELPKEEPSEEMPSVPAEEPAAPPAAAEASGEPDAGKKEKGGAVVPRKKGGLAKKISKGDYLVRPDPVTIGRNLRTDEMLVYDSELDEIDYTDDEDLPEIRDYLPIRFGRHGRVGIAGGVMYALCVISISIVLACICWMFAADVLALGKDPKTAVVFIEEYVPGEGDPVYSVVNDEEREIQVDIDQVAAELKGAGIIEYKWLFKLFSQFSHAETKIDPGTYSVSTALDYRAIVTALQFGSDSQEITKVTFPEGFSMAQIFALLEENHICRAKDLYEAAANYEFDYDFLSELELGDPNRLEGYLFPDTYEFYQGEDATVAISRFLRNFNNRFDDELRARAEKKGYSIHEILTIASLIEKESGGGEESPIIASVIYNRLDDGWKLELDSTINYIKGTSTFGLTYDDLAIDDPYNTYLYEGLPPGPICNPGLESIKAALYPDSTNYWFWYAADGETHFFTNSDDFYAFAQAHPY